MEGKKKEAEKNSAEKISRRSFIKKTALTTTAATLQWPSWWTDPARAWSPTFAKKRIAVIGAGAFGGWSALQLLRKGADVTLLDAWGPGNSRASSGGETRVIRGIYGPDRIYVELVTRAFELWRESQKRWNTQLYRKTGTLWMFGVDDSYARNSLPLQREFGLQVDELSAETARQRYPQISFDGIQSIYYEHEAGYLNARQACRVVRDAFIQEGGNYQQRSVRPGPFASGSLSHARLSDGSRLSADGYVFACGPWLGKLFPEAIGKRIEPSRQEVYYFGTPSGDQSFSQDKLPIWVEFGDKIIYGIPGAAERGFKVADDTRGQSFDPTSGDRTTSEEKIAETRRFLAKRFPKLTDAPIIETRVCQYENSPDGHFIIDRHPAADNLWIVGGGSGHGFKVGPALGEFVAKRVLDEAPVEPFFALERLRGKDDPVSGQNQEMNGFLRGATNS
jgi:glycine/D-amino acid oxidase-like deaminating enzyme